jgi:hypothetical protein
MTLLPRGTIENHQVVGANILACSFVPAFATVTFFIYYKTWHLAYLLNLMGRFLEFLDDCQKVFKKNKILHLPSSD